MLNRPAVALLCLSLTACGDPVVLKEYLAVIDISPSHGAVNVSTKVDVRVVFNAGIDPDTAQGRLSLYDVTGVEVPSALEYDEEDQTLVLTPQGELLSNSEYSVVLSEGIESDLGPLLATINAEFTTEGASLQGNNPPNAVATPMGDCLLGELLPLDGGASTDPDGDVLSFAWRVVSAPAGAPPTLDSADQAMADFTAFVAGEYVVGLVVSDGDLFSSEAYVELSCL